MSVPPFPQELVDIIIDILCDDPCSLKACSMVCREWTHRPRVHLLQKGIVFDLKEVSFSRPKSTNDKAVSLHECLSNNPLLTEYVHSVELRNLLWRSSEQWEHVLSQILLSLKHIRRLSLQKVRWYFISDELQGALSEVLKEPHLESIHFEGLVVREQSTLRSLLSFPPNLRTLWLKDTRCTDIQSGDAGPLGRGHIGAGRLEELTLVTGDSSEASRVLEWFFTSPPPFDLSSVRHLHMCDTIRSHFAGCLVRASAQSLEYLELESWYDYYTSEPMITAHLNDLPRLRCLVLTHKFLKPLIGRVFGNLRENHPFEEIRIKMLTMGSRESWLGVDAFLTQPQLGCLRRVEFLIMQKSWSEASRDAFLNQFPKLRSRGLCHICLV
ncbi:hypothetical protein Hypma_006403 [Hypsizygus marmoreus]|uniref:F-box domain-containing protein n=1 Tax=Hypsizygus marmoreus TaxID=39966 RepID=A0A369K2V5_HYPMA|nr:hypothetical protein Hypma_006403 [Hypsizygus marmoreus]